MSTTIEWQKQRAHSHLIESAAAKQQVAQTCMGAILSAANLIIQTFRAGGKLLLCGNGGSAADCQHMAAEFTNRLTTQLERPPLPAIALTTDTSFLTAHGNDYGFETVFERQVQAIGRPGDLLLGISTSGNSINVVRAITQAHTLNLKTIALSGRQGQMLELATIAISVPSDKTQYIQEAHLAIEHILCDLVEQALFGKNSESSV